MRYKIFVALATSAIGLISFSAHAGITETASLSNSGASIAARSDYMTRNGRYVIFATQARAVPEDINLDDWDVYIRDLEKDVTELVSVTQSGIASGWVRDAQVSADGRFVIFSSTAAGIVPNDTNGGNDIFIRDREKKTTERVTMTHDGGQISGNGVGTLGISDDGRYVFYNANVPNIVPNDTDNSMDIFLYDREKKVTERVNQSSQGIRFDGFWRAKMSADARYIMIGSSDKLLSNDNNSRLDAYVKDRVKNTLELVSVSSTGQQSYGDCRPSDMTPNGRYYLIACAGLLNDAPATGSLFLRDIETKTTVRATSGIGDAHSDDAAISADGRFVGFMSGSRLVAEDTNTAFDVYLYDREKKQNQLISVATNGAITEDWSTQRYSQISISDDGQKVRFTSNSKNLGAPAPQISGFLSYVRNTQFGCF